MLFSHNQCAEIDYPTRMYDKDQIERDTQTKQD